MQSGERKRPSPEALLRLAEAEERFHKRGRLKVFLGYASGVGKTLRMLNEGRRRKMRGEDVVVGATQASHSDEASQGLAEFETIPLRGAPGAQFIDVPAILKRHPGVCLIDGLAFDNPPACKHSHRWQDVEELLAEGISVLTSINLQFVQERQEQVEAIRGKKVADSVPEAFLKTADEIEVVDAPPEYCLLRATQRDGEPGEDPALLERQLSELREIALVLAAEVVDKQLEESLRREGIQTLYGTHERILVCVTPRSDAYTMIRRGRRQADRFHGDMYVVHVEQEGLNAADQAMLDRNLANAREARATIEILHGDDPIAAILQFAREHGITQIFVGHSQPRGWLSNLRPNPLERLILDSDGMDVRIFPHGAQANG